MRAYLTRTCLLLALLLPMAVFGDITSKGDTGFNLEITAEVPSSPLEAYDQFLRINEWWVKSHTWFGDAANLSIEPVAGGCFCEISGEKQALHMLVSFVNPGVEIKMVGGLGPLQMMGVHGGMSWRFEAIETGTRIVLRYNVTGYASGGLTDLADIVDAVQTQQVEALATKLRSVM